MTVNSYLPLRRRCLMVAFPLFTSLASLTQAGLTVTPGLSDNGLAARTVQWVDAAGLARSAVMVDQRAAGAGYLRQLNYVANGASRTCRGSGANGHQGDGYVQNHTASGGDSSSHGTPGTTAVLLAGAHHAIISYQMPTYTISGATVPTTVQWFFADGRSHPIFSICQDARNTGGNLGADSRSPYGDISYDGSANAAVGGASFGDTWKFTTLAANPERVTKATGWRYNQPNTIPYAMQWADPAQADAEMGHVATLPISVQDQGSDPRVWPTVDVRGTQDLDGPMITDEQWTYQILNYVLPNSGPTTSKRLTWGTNWGLPGGFNNWGDGSLNVRQYSQHATSVNGALNGTRKDGMLMAYSVFVVLGTHTGGYLGGTVGQTVTQMENAAAATFAATQGTVRTSGPSGAGAAASVPMTFSPAGYSPVSATWEIDAAANSVTATLTPAAGKPLDHPVIVINNFTAGQLPASISVGTGLSTPDVDYFATLDAANSKIYLTVNRLVSSPLTLKIGDAAPPPPPPPGGLAGTFQQMDSDGGGWFTGMAIHASGRLYGRTDVGGVYRSVDHGDSWNFLSGNMTDQAGHCVQGLAVAAGNADVVYQCTGTSYLANNAGCGIWKTTDGGTSWAQVKSGLNFSGNDIERWGGECVAVRPGNDSQVWAGTRGQGLWRSMDAGNTWAQVSPNMGTFGDAQFTSISMPPAGRSDIWVGSSGFGGVGAVWVSVDEGNTWTMMTGDRSGVMAPDGCWRILREPNGNVLVSGGNDTVGSVLYEFTAASWLAPENYEWTDRAWPDISRPDHAPLASVLADGRIIAGSLFGGYAFGPDSLRTQIRSNAGVWTPTDSLSGTMPAWQRSPAPVMIEGGRNALVQDPTDASRWFMAGGYAPFRTTNAGASWQYITNGIDETVNYKVSFHPTVADRVCLPMADHGGAMVMDGGASGALSGFLSTRSLAYPDDLCLCRSMLASGDRVLALGGDERDNWRPRLYTSPNNGQSWSLIYNGATKVPAGLPNEDHRGILSAVASRDNGDDLLVAVGGTVTSTTGGVYRSVNAGLNFTRCTGLPVDADFGSEFNVLADLEADATNQAVRYLFLKLFGLYKSTNRGATWSLVNTGLPDWGVMAADAKVAGQLWVGTCCNQPVGLTRSTDGGSTWTSIPGFVNVEDVDAADGRVAVLGKRTGDTFNRVYYSGNNGSSWDEITRPNFRLGNAQAVAVDPWRVGSVWISTNGRSVTRFTPTPAVPVTGYATWAAAWPSLGVATADPDQDGRANLMEYALGGNPLVFDQTGLAVSRNAQGKPKLTVSKNTTAMTDGKLHYIFQSSTDMQDWKNTATAGANLSVVSAGNITEATFTGTSRKAFIRLLVQMDP